MALHSMAAVLVAVLIVVGGGGGGVAEGQQEAPGSAPAMSPGPDCMTALFNMSDCLGYVTPGSKEKKPDQACCPELAGLVDSQPLCLCQLLGGGAAAEYGISIDYARALELPKKCRVDTPPVSLCAAIGIPVNLGPSLAPESGGPSPSTSPLLPGSTPTTTPSGADRRIQGFRAANLVFLAVLSYAVAASGVF